MIDLNCQEIINSHFTIGPLKYKFYERNLYFLEGANGCGKSTILRYIYNNILSAKERKMTFYAADIYAGYLNITIEETIQIFKLKYYECFDIEKFNYYCHNLGVQNHKRKVKTLSSGEKIILMFSLLMACSPKIIIFDETLYPVDKLRRKTILSLLKEYVEKDDAIFIGTSHGDDLNMYANVILTLKDGELTNKKKNVLSFENDAGKDNSSFVDTGLDYSFIIKKAFNCLKCDLIIAKKSIYLSLLTIIAVNFIAIITENDPSTIPMIKAIIISSMILNLGVINYGFKQEELPQYKYIIAMSDIDIRMQIIARFILFLVVPIVILIIALLFNISLLFYVSALVLFTSGLALFTYYRVGSSFLGVPFLFVFISLYSVTSSDIQITINSNDVIWLSLLFYILTALITVTSEYFGWNVYSKIPKN